MCYFKGIFIFAITIFAIQVHAQQDFPLEKSYFYETRQNGRIISTSKQRVTYIEIEAGYTWGNCRKDCKDKFYYYMGENYRTLKEYIEEEAYKILAHSAPVSELEFKDQAPKRIIIALSDDIDNFYRPLLLEQVKKDFEELVK